MTSSQRTTRLAPSPTGALHLGNARTFLINWAMARHAGWKIVLRIEDLDTPRVKLAGGTVVRETIALLEWLGINWDDGPIMQSADAVHHRNAMERLVASGRAYPTAMTRTQIGEALARGADAMRASGSISVSAAESQGDSPQSAPNEGTHEVAFPARLRPEAWFALAASERSFGDDAPTWRFVTPDASVRFEDAVAGSQEHFPARTVGDFIIWTRRDAAVLGQPAYQLAVVVDDARQGVTDIVRGDDLLDSTARQLLLADALGMWPGPNRPQFYHLPLVRGMDGRRLAKRHGDTRLDWYRSKGVAAERVIGLIAFWSGVTTRRESMSSAEFRERFEVDKLPKGSVVFGPEDDAWLLART